MPATDPSRRITGRKRFERSLVDRIGHGLAGQQTAHFDDDGRQQIRAIDTVSFQARLNRVTIIPSANPKTMTMTPAMRRP